MSEPARVALFLAIVLSSWLLMHLYVGYRLGCIPVLASRVGYRALVMAGTLLFLSYPLGRLLHHRGWLSVGYVLELLGAQWMGMLFLLMCALLLVDLATGFGTWARQYAAAARLGAAAVAVLLAGVATVQGLRQPVIRRAEIRLPGLPAATAGLRLVHLSDLHLGSLLGPRWLAVQVDRVLAERPDLVVITGDLIDSDSRQVENMLPELQRLQAPLGVYAVTGNHEFYAGLERSLALFHAAGLVALRNCAIEVRPGLVLAGIDDLTASRQFGLAGDPLAAALASRPSGATILLSHTPWRAAEAAARRVGLMLSGHTHDGQIWPFGVFVRLQYPLMGGRYQVGGMQVLVSRGTGTWGPRMRLWRPSEIWVLTLLPESPS